MLDAYARRIAPRITNPQYTDGRTDGQDVEPPHLRDLLPLCDARETSGEKSTIGDEKPKRGPAADPTKHAAAARAAMREGVA